MKKYFIRYSMSVSAPSMLILIVNNDDRYRTTKTKPLRELKSYTKAVLDVKPK